MRSDGLLSKRLLHGARRHQVAGHRVARSVASRESSRAGSRLAQRTTDAPATSGVTSQSTRVRGGGGADQYPVGGQVGGAGPGDQVGVRGAVGEGGARGVDRGRVVVAVGADLDHVVERPVGRAGPERGAQRGQRQRVDLVGRRGRGAGGRRTRPAAGPPRARPSARPTSSRAARRRSASAAAGRPPRCRRGRGRARR